MNIPGLRRPDEEDDLLNPLAMPNVGPEAPAAVGGGGAPVPVPPAPPAPTQAPGGVALQVVQPPAEVSRTEWQGPEVTTKLPSEAAAKAHADLEIAQRAESKAAEQEHQAKTPQMRAEAIAAEERALAAERAAIQKRMAQLDHERAVRARMEEGTRRREEMEADRKITDFFEDRGAPARVVSAFLVGLNEFARHGRGMGGPNMAWEILQDAQARDRQTKIDKFVRSKEFYELYQKDAAAADAAYKERLKDIDDEQIAQTNLIEKQLGSIVAKLKIPQAQAEFQKLQAQTQKANAEKLASIHAHYDRTVKDPTTSGSHTVNTGGAAQGGDKNLVVPGYGIAPDEVVRRTMAAKAAAYEKVKTLTDRLGSADVKAPLGSQERQQVDNDLRELAVNLAIMNNNEGKPSDADIRIAEKQVGSTLAMGTRAQLAEKYKKPGLDPRTGWRILGKRMDEKWAADLKANLGPGLDPEALKRVTGEGAKAPQPKDGGGKPKPRTKVINGKRYVNDGRGWIEID